MQQLRCEMCGGPDLIKQDGVFVCQNCGMKYSLEDAKKMMIEGTVEVQGTVKVDNSSFVEKYLENGRRAYSKDDWEEVEKYYNMVERNAPHNIEALFFSAYGKAMLSMTDSDYYKREQKFNVLVKSMSVISDYYEETTEDKEKVLWQISAAICKMYGNSYVYNKDKSLSYTVGSPVWMENLKKRVQSAFLIELKEISLKHQNESYLDDLISMDGACVKFELDADARQFLDGLLATDQEDAAAKYLCDIKGLKTVEAKQCCQNYLNHGRLMYKPTNTSSSSGGCYVATAVYGSYDCPQVWTLRRYRDYTLAETWYGRAFVKTYYAVSPTLVKWFGHTEWFKKMWKGKLDRMVAELNAKGVKDTPYEDKVW